MAISIYLSTIILKVNGLNDPIKTHRGAEQNNNKSHLYAAYSMLSSYLRHTETEIEGIEKGITCKWTGKNWGNNDYIIIYIYNIYNIQYIHYNIYYNLYILYYNLFIQYIIKYIIYHTYIYTYNVCILYIYYIKI